MAVQVPFSSAEADGGAQDGANLAAWIATQVAAAPPLSGRQRRALGALLNQPPMPRVVADHGRLSKPS
jgi:hypothetical protein